MGRLIRLAHVAKMSQSFEETGSEKTAVIRGVERQVKVVMMVCLERW